MPACDVRPLTLDRLVLTDLRNVVSARLAPGRVNVIAGDNGQGKTSILEGIYLLATTRSFRTARLSDLTRHEAAVSNVKGTFTEHWDGAPVLREQSVGLARGRRTVRLDREAPPSLRHYATRSPVVVFDPTQMSLSTGPANERRTLLDRVTLFTRPEVASHRARYGRALRERAKLLSLPGEGGGSASAALDAYEALLAEHGAAITRGRSAACATLAEVMGQTFAEIAAPDLTLEVSYASGGSEDPERSALQLRNDRRLDAQRKRTGHGPHRDDLTFRLDGHPARVVASQGQHRALTLALKLAELRCIAVARGVQPILLLDDVSSELDADRSAALFAHLTQSESQIFLTTTRRSLIVTHPDADRRDYTVVNGEISVVSGS
ncbi:MAG: DNA replication and repair protein RecF [Myxococcota bacterium]